MEQIVEMAFLLILAVPLGRLVFDSGLRRRFCAFPPMQVFLSASLALYLLITGVIAFASPELLRPLAIAGVIVIAIDWWQCRSNFGSRRGFPPGSLKFMRAAAWKDPRFYEKEATRHGPVFKFRHIVDPAVGIVGLERIGDFMRSNEKRLLIPPAPFNALIPGGFVRYMSGSEHQNVSTLLRSAFTSAVIDACGESFSQCSRLALDSMTSAKGDGIDPLPVIERLVYDEMMLCFLGIRPGDEYDRYVRLYETADYRTLTRTGKPAARAAILSIVSEMRTLAQDGQSLDRISFLTELKAAHPESIASDEVLGNFAYALHTARLDVSGLLVWLLAVLAENPAWVVKLRDAVNVDEAGAVRVGGMGDRIVRETLRLRQSEFLLRRTKETIEWEGYRIPSGWHLRMCIAESHRSAESFDEPEVFNPDRFLQSPNRSKYSPFGLAPHLCPGEHLTRAMGRFLAVEIARKYTMTADNIEPWEFSGFHWRPGPRMRVQLSPVS